jgi:hypothetical protein
MPYFAGDGNSMNDGSEDGHEDDTSENCRMLRGIADPTYIQEACRCIPDKATNSTVECGSNQASTMNAAKVIGSQLCCKRPIPRIARSSVP